MLMEYKILQNLTASNHILFYFKVNDSGFLQLSLSHLRKYVGHRVLNFLWGLKIFTNVIVTITLLQSQQITFESGYACFLINHTFKYLKHYPLTWRSLATCGSTHLYPSLSVQIEGNCLVMSKGGWDVSQRGCRLSCQSRQSPCLIKPTLPLQKVWNALLESP